MRGRTSFVARHCAAPTASSGALTPAHDVNVGSRGRLDDVCGVGDEGGPQEETLAEREDRLKSRRELFRAAFLAEARAKENLAQSSSLDSCSSSSSERKHHDMHDDEAIEVTEEEAQAEDDAVSSEEDDSSYDDDVELSDSSSEPDADDGDDADYDPNDDPPPTVEDEGYYGYVDLVDGDTDCE